MKKVIFMLGCFLIINSSNCFSQSAKKDNIEYESKTKYIYGYSNNFSDEFLMGIAFAKAINSMDTTYYIKLNINAPASKYQADICFSREGELVFLAKNGNSVKLKLTDRNPSITPDKQAIYQASPINVINSAKTYEHSVNFMLEVTKAELIKIASEPFHKILLPYFNCSSKDYTKIEFVKTTLLSRKTFIQKSIDYILSI